jgi:transposase InsO family protein
MAPNPGLSTITAVSSSIEVSLRSSKTHNLIDIKTRPRHPESNGIVERFNGTVRDESNNDYGNNLRDQIHRFGGEVQQYGDFEG